MAYVLFTLRKINQNYMAQSKMGKVKLDITDLTGKMSRFHCGIGKIATRILEIIHSDVVGPIIK